MWYNFTTVFLFLYSYPPRQSEAGFLLFKGMFIDNSRIIPSFFAIYNYMFLLDFFIERGKVRLLNHLRLNFLFISIFVDFLFNHISKKIFTIL